MITICSDDSMHLWNLKSKKIEIIQSLRFQKERYNIVCVFVFVRVLSQFVILTTKLFFFVILTWFFITCFRITSTYLAFQSKWLYLGTERGNTYVVNVETFSLSGYVINWNKAIEL